MQEHALQTQTSITEESGTSMDQKIENTSLSWRKITLGIIILIAVVALVLILKTLVGERSFRIDGNTLRVAEVARGSYRPYPTTRQHLPSHYRILDATDGGRVDQVYVEDGQIVEKGDLIISFSNSGRLGRIDDP